MITSCSSSPLRLGLGACSSHAMASSRMLSTSSTRSMPTTITCDLHHHLSYPNVNSHQNHRPPMSSTFRSLKKSLGLSMTNVLTPRRREIYCKVWGRGDGDGKEIEGPKTKRKPSVERSEAANEELLLFFFQLDLTTRLQRALNQDMYDVAQQLREKIAEVEMEVTRQRDAKMGSVSSKDEAQDTAITILQLRAELQKFIQEEDYAGAGKLKKKISGLEAESLAAQAKAMVFRQLNFHFRLGQKVRHRVYGYRGVVCGMDPLCCESASWAESVGVNQLPRGRNQPFYQVLVDVQEDPSLMVTYVAEDNLDVPEEPDLEQFDHPYIYFLFYGMDGAGDFIACKQLRDKYNAPRRELPYEGDEGNEDDSTPPPGPSGPD